LDLRHLFRGLAPNSITTIAGAGYRDAVPAREADAGWLLGVVRLPDGDIVVADYKAHRLWRIDRDGTLHTFAGDGVPGYSGDGSPACRHRRIVGDTPIPGEGFALCTPEVPILPRKD